MPENTINGQTFESETEARLYQEVLNMVNGDANAVHEETLRTVVNRHANEDILREASDLAHRFGFTDYERELSEQYALVRDLEANANKFNDVLNVLLNDRDKTPNLTNEEHIARYENALLRAGFSHDDIRQLLNDYQLANPVIEIEPTEPEEEKPLEVEDQDITKKAVVVPEEAVKKMSINASLDAVEMAEQLRDTIEFSNKRLGKKYFGKIKWKSLSQVQKSKDIQKKWAAQLAVLERSMSSINPNQKKAYESTIASIKANMRTNEELLETIEVREFGKQADGSYKGGRVQFDKDNKLSIRRIKTNILRFPKRLWSKIMYKLETLGLEDAENMVNGMTPEQNELKELDNKLGTLSRCCLKITNSGIALGHETLEAMQGYYEKAKEIVASIESYSPGVRELLKSRIDETMTVYHDMEEKYQNFVSTKIDEVETAVNELHASIADDVEHDIENENKKLAFVQGVYSVCAKYMDDTVKQNMETKIQQAENELHNKAIYLKYKERFERSESLIKLDPTKGAEKLDSILQELKAEQFQEAVKYNKNDLIQAFEDERTRLLGQEIKKEERQPEPVEVIEEIPVVSPVEEPSKEKEPVVQSQPEVSPSPETIVNQQMKEIFKRQKQTIDEKDKLIQELQNQIAAQTKENQALKEINRNYQKNLAEMQAKETLQTEKLAAENKMYDAIAGIKREARVLGEQKTQLEWEIKSLKDGVQYLDAIRNMPMVQAELSRIASEQERIERLHQLAEGYANRKNAMEIAQKQQELSKVAEQLQALDSQITTLKQNYKNVVTQHDEMKRKAEETTKQNLSIFENKASGLTQQREELQKQALEAARVNEDDLFAQMEAMEQGKTR